MSDCQTKLNEIKTNCKDLYKSSCQDIKIEPEFGTCSYYGAFPDNSVYSGSTRCYRGQLIDTPDGPQLCPIITGNSYSSGPYFTCDFVPDPKKTSSTFTFTNLSIIIFIIIFIIILLYFFYIRKRK